MKNQLNSFRAFLVRANITIKEYEEFKKLNSKEKLVDKQEKEKHFNTLSKIIDTRRAPLNENKICETVEGLLS